MESLVQEAVFVGIAIWFFLSLESRLKRRRALRAVHELRSIAHIVDMHQLTKDPERLSSSEPDTASSPVRELSREQLGRYLDYCSELLSVTSKLAALYVQYSNDPVVLDTAHAGWRIDPDQSKLPPGIKQVFDYFGPNGSPGTWHMWPYWTVVSEALVAAALVGGSELVQLVAPLLADAVMYCVECGAACLGFVAIP